MKKSKLLNLLCLSLLTLYFTSCENEPLEGQFAQIDNANLAAEGQFIAKVSATDFLTENASGILYSDNVLVVTGIIDSTGASISLRIEDAGLGTFNITAVAGTQNSGTYIVGETIPEPYVSTGIFGGTGTMDITAMDTELLTISGTFSFTGVRLTFDANGDPIVDSNGDPILDTIEITSGSFTTISYVVDTHAGGSLGDQFVVMVDDVAFISETVSVAQTTVGSVPMINIVVTDKTGAYIRLDVPEALGIGTFDMESISDGTKLIGLYNPNLGEESLSSNPGTITITEFDTETGALIGTFSFTATDPLGQNPAIVEITEGSFLLDYIN